MAAGVIAGVIVAMQGSALMLMRWATWMWRESGSVALRDRTPFGHLEAGQVADGRDPWMLGEIGQVDGAMHCCRVIAPYCNPDGLGPPSPCSSRGFGWARSHSRPNCSAARS